MFCNHCGMNNREGSQFCSTCAAPMLANNQNQQRFHQGFNQNQQQHFHQGFNGNQVVQTAGASGRAIAAMLLSLASVLLCGFLVSIPGMILGKVEMNAIREGRAPQAGLGYAKTGFYVGLVVTIISGVIAVITIMARVIEYSSY